MTQDESGHGGRRGPEPSPVGSERPFSRRPSTQRLTALQVLVDELTTRYTRDLHVATGRAFDEGQEAERARTDGLQASLGRADAMIWELQSELRQAQDDVEAARDEVRLRGDKIQELQLLLDEVQAELHRVRADRDSMRAPRPIRERRSVTQMQVPVQQERLIEQTREGAAEEFTRLTGRPPPLSKRGDE